MLHKLGAHVGVHGPQNRLSATSVSADFGLM